MDKARGLLEVDAAGQVIRELAQDTLAREQHHDVIATAQNTLLFIAFDVRTYAGVPLKGEAIWEWTPETGATVRRWSSWDALDPGVDRGPRFGREWMHANALGIGPRGNTLLSVHYFNQVISIAANWSSMEWRLGGVNATVAVADPFSGQHTARELSSGRVLLFDNHRDPNGPASRAVEYQLLGDSAVVAWQWTPASANYAAAVSSARRLANGNTVVGFGMSAGLTNSTGPTEVYEVTAEGQVVWHLSLETQVMFRAEPLPSVGDEHTLEP
jgi:hypothetical protein